VSGPVTTFDPFGITADLIFGSIPRLLMIGGKLLSSLHGSAPDTAAQDRLLQVLSGTGAGTPPPPPGGQGGLQDGAGRAGDAYGRAGGATAGIDQKLVDTLKQIFAANDDLRTKAMAILSDVSSKHQQVMADPTLSKDPAALKALAQYTDNKLGDLKQLFDQAKVDSGKQTDLLKAIGDEYGGKGGQGGSGSQGGGSGAGGSGSGGSGSGGDQGGGAGGSGAGGGSGGSGAGAADPPVDPLAGMGLPGGGMGMDPLSSMLGPPLAGLSGLGSAVPGGLGGAGLPLDALGGLSQLAGQHGNGFNDDSPGKQENPDGKSDGKSDGGKGDVKPPGFTDVSGNQQGQQQGQPGITPAGTPSAASAQSGTPVAAAPAAASSGDPSRVVQFPDGTPVTASSAQTAGLVRAVLGGQSVTEACKAAGVSIPPPGTPVTQPADPDQLTPGMLAQYKSREPIMFMGNDKIELDGQLQPKSALPQGDFLGWFDPTQAAGATQAPAPSSTAPGSAPVSSAPTTGS
jgi:hypothetical protein